MNKRIFHCHGCRQKKEIVLGTKGMNYCIECEHKAPTAKEFASFKNEKFRLRKDGNSTKGGWKKKARIEDLKELA